MRTDPTAVSRTPFRVTVVLAFVLAMFAQGMVGFGPQQRAAAPAQAGACVGGYIDRGNDMVGQQFRRCTSPGRPGGDTTEGSETGTAGGGEFTYTKKVCNTLYYVHYKDGVEVTTSVDSNSRRDQGTFGTARNYDAYYYPDGARPVSPFAQGTGSGDAVWPGAWDFTAYDCDHYRARSTTFDVCTRERIRHRHSSRRRVRKYGYHTHEHYGSYSWYEWGIKITAYGYHDRNHYDYYSQWETSYWYEYHWRTNCEPVTIWTSEHYRSTYHEDFRRRCTFACSRPGDGPQSPQLSKTVPDPSVEHSPRAWIPGVGGAAQATFVNTPTRFWATNANVFQDRRDLDGDGNRSEPRWVRLTTIIDGPGTSEWRHHVVAYPDRARIVVTGSGNRRWVTTCSIQRFTDPDRGCSISIDTGSIDTSFGGVSDAYEVHADVRWRYYCVWKNNRLYRNTSPRPTVTGCDNRRHTGNASMFDRTPRYGNDGTVYSESWQDPAISSEQNGDTGDADRRIPLRVNEIQSTNRDT